MPQYLCIEKIPVEEIVQELFDFTKVGAVSIQNVLPPEAREGLVQAFQSSQAYFKLVERQKRSGVIQEMSTLYLEREKNVPALLLEQLSQLTKEYTPLYQQIAQLAQFQDAKFNSFGIHYYPAGSAGISAHQDYAQDVNVVASFVVKGNAPFYVCSTRDGKNAQCLDSSPGTLILMRAARNTLEQSCRPFHYLVGPMREPRYSILIRTRSLQKMKELETEY